MVKIFRKSQGSTPNIKCFCWPKLDNVKDRVQIQVYRINKETVTQFSQFISEKVKKSLRKSQAKFWEKLRKVRFRPNDGFLVKSTYDNFFFVRNK